jgi:hypothetical protein
MGKQILEKTAAGLFFSGLAIGIGGVVYSANHLGGEGPTQPMPGYLAQTTRDQVKALGVIMFGGLLATLGIAAGTAALVRALVAPPRG